MNQPPPRDHPHAPAIVMDQRMDLDRHRARLLAQRSSLHRTLQHLTDTALPTAASRALLARKRHIKQAALLLQAQLRVTTARSALSKVLHTVVPTQLPPALQLTDTLAHQVTTLSDQRVRQCLADVAAAQQASPPLALTDDQAAEVQRVSHTIAQHAASLLAVRTEITQLQAFRDALLSAPTANPPHSTSSSSAVHTLLARCQDLAATHATTSRVALPLTAHLVDAREAHSAHMSHVLEQAVDAVTRHAAVLRVLLQVQDAFREHVDAKAREVSWVRQHIVQGCADRIRPMAHPGPTSVDHVARDVQRIKRDLAVPAPRPSSSARAGLVDAVRAVQQAVQGMVSHATPATGLPVDDTVSERVTELTMSVPRMADLVDRLVARQGHDHHDDDEDDWVRWLMGQVKRVGQEFKAEAAGGAVESASSQGAASRVLLDEYL